VPDAPEALSQQDTERFNQLVLPHLDSAFNLARWLVRNRTDAQDVTQDAMLRAYRFFGGFHGGDARAWLLQIVRNTCFSWMEKNRRPQPEAEFNEEVHVPNSITPEALAIASNNRDRLARRSKLCRRASAKCSCCVNWKDVLIRRLRPSLRYPSAR
jgi:RNA polymerase sigma-70 factor (ECF subfamily)